MSGRHKTNLVRRNRKRGPFGYSLVELVVAMASSTVLMGGLASTLYISSQALDVDDSATADTSRAAEVLADLTADLRHARRFSERTATAVTFTVPDRDGDLRSETIRYAWSGTPGDPLTYQTNGGSVVTLADNVQSFNLTGRTRQMSADAITIPVIPVVFEEFTELKASTNATSLAIALPPGTSADDLLVACVATDADEVASLAPLAGWNIVDVGHEQGTVTFGTWWKLATAAESSTQTFTWANGQKGWGWIMRFTGHDTANPIHATATASGQSSSPTSPAVTTTVDNTMILRLGGFDNKNVTVGDTGLAGHTTITMDISGTSGGNVSGGAGYVTQTTAADSGTATFALTNSQEYRAVTIAIAPAQ